MPLRCEQLEGRDTPAAIVVAGGHAFALDDAGSVVRDYGQVVESASRDVPFQVAVSADGKLAVLGAGAGGGPRVIGLDLDSGAVTFSVFVGDPDSRSGVGVGWLGRVPAGTSGSPLRAEGSPTDPASAADVAAVQRVVDQLPAAERRYLAARGQHVYVYAGNAVTDDPAFAALRGQPTAAAGDGTRTWDQVPALYTTAGGGAAYVNGRAAVLTVFHELGHAAEFAATDADRAAWLAIYTTTTTFPTDYERLNEQEAFAESARRWASGVAEPDPRIGPFFDALFAGS